MTLTVSQVVYEKRQEKYVFQFPAGTRGQTVDT